MKTILDELNEAVEIQAKIDILQRKTVSVPKWVDIEKEYDAKQHRIFDKKIFPDKQRKGKPDVPITRIGIGFQKLAAKRMSEMMFTLPVTISHEDDDSASTENQFRIFRKILDRIKWDTLNITRGEIASSQCELATYWYTVEGKKEHKKYGEKTKKKLRFQVFSPALGDELFPLFDETGDMVAFSRRFQIDGPNNTKITCFETWSDTEYIRWEQQPTGNMAWTEVDRKEIAIGKIPIAYMYKPLPVWADADHGKIDAIEVMLSQEADILGYHNSPVLIIKGKLAKDSAGPEKGEANKVYMTDNGGGAEYVSWDQMPEAMRFLFDSAVRTFFMELQLADLSFENIKGLGAASGEARKWLLADSHLKVGHEAPAYIDMMEREFSIIKSYMAWIFTKYEDIDDMEIDIKINPFMINDDLAQIDILVKANGNNPVISQEQSVALSPLTKDPAKEWDKIKAEQKEAAERDLLDPYVTDPRNED